MIYCSIVTRKCILFLVIFLELNLKASDFKQLTLDVIFKSDSFNVEYPYEYKHLRDGEHFASLNTDGNIIKMSYINPYDTVILFYNNDFRDKIGAVYTYDFSENEKNILLATNMKKKYRHSYIADYWIYNIERIM